MSVDRVVGVIGVVVAGRASQGVALDPTIVACGMAGTRVTTGSPGPKKVGVYDVDRMIGKGGMGEVFVGQHPRLKRQVALKRVIADSAGGDVDADLVERFIREGQAMARLRHESIPCIYDLFEHRGSWWMALEYVDGFTIAELTKGGTLPPDVACLVAIGVARALSVAHRHGILHRDIKPANVMLASDGTVKLMDFGIAKVIDQHTLTDTGAVVGTPAYLAPEVVKGDDASERSDVYAVGALLYEMLSGQRLFQHANGANVWALVATGKFPKLSTLAPQLPWRLTLLVQRALKTEPKRRPHSAAELASLLERFLDDYGGPDDPALRLTGWLVAVGKVPEETLTAMIPDVTGDYVVLEEVPLKRRVVPWRLAALASMLTTTTLLLALTLTTDLVPRIFSALSALSTHAAD